MMPQALQERVSRVAVEAHEVYLDDRYVGTVRRQANADGWIAHPRNTMPWSFSTLDEAMEYTVDLEVRAQRFFAGEPS